jgi:histidine ammonia-lyase
MTFHISSAPLTLHSIRDLLATGSPLALSDESKRLVQTCKNYLDRKIASSGEPLYGITTGFGSLCKINISREDLSQLQANLVMSHACSLGNPIHPEIARLMLLLKVHALSLGKSGVQLATVERIVDMYNKGVLPVVRELGSLGASGDLAPLANLFLPLIGEGEVLYKGAVRPAAPVLQALGWAPLALEAKEGLALLNGTQFMSAHAVHALLKSLKLVEQADMIGALSLDAYDGRIEPFLPQVHAARPHPGQVETARNIRALLEGSAFQRVEKVHVQDPYSFRCMPQVHGATRDAVAHVAAVVEREINSVTDNPTIFVDDDLILSGGNFHGQPLALALDYLSIAIAELGSISERRTYRLISGNRKTPEFLIANSGLNSGFMIPQYAAAAIVSQNKQLCTPCSVDSIPSSNEQEDHVSMGGNAATKCVKVVENVERVLAIELMNAAQAIDLQRPLRTSPRLEHLLASFRATVPFNSEDRVMYREIDRAVAFLQQL